MTREETSLLLFLETQAVDGKGVVKMDHMNSDDVAIAKRWDAEGFIGFGRIRYSDVTQHGSHWVRLSDEAWAAAAQARRDRADRALASRKWEPTREGAL